MSSACPIVETKLGRVKGRLLQKPSNGKQVYNYTSLPFAKPPVGELRFEPPTDPEPWDGVLDGAKNPAMPYQMTDLSQELDNFFVYNDDQKLETEELSEDCLYLSLYTTNPSKTANLPVLVFIYGGDFYMGSQGTYNGNILSSLNNVVVVVPNYRVGVFGFLSMADDNNYRGNIGLLDQVQALKWTRDHIRGFGGNPQNVTIIGESAGSISVSYHMLSPLSRGLFHKAISCSGTATMPGITRKDNKDMLASYLEALKIKETNTSDIIAKLKSLPADELNNAQTEMIMANGMGFFPCIDENFLPDEPLKLLERGDVAPVPYMIGCNNTEYLGILTFQEPASFTKGLSEEAFNASVKMQFEQASKIKLSDASLEKIKEKYSSAGIDAEDKYEWSKMYGELMGDFVFYLPGIECATYHASLNHPTYFYYMTQALRIFHDSEYGQPEMMKPPFCECDHADDLYFTFGVALDEGRLTKDVKFTDAEKQLSKEWMAYLTNFAKSGNPNIGSTVMREWPLHTVDDQKYLSVQQPCSVKKSLNADRVQFWEEMQSTIFQEST